MKITRTSNKKFYILLKNLSRLLGVKTKSFKDPRPNKPEKISYPADVQLTDEEQKILGQLKTWRQAKANDLNWPAYMICSNAELLSLIKTKPESLDQLLNIKGFGDQKIAKFGEEIIAFFNSI